MGELFWKLLQDTPTTFRELSLTDQILTVMDKIPISWQSGIFVDWVGTNCSSVSVHPLIS